MGRKKTIETKPILRALALLTTALALTAGPWNILPVPVVRAYSCTSTGSGNWGDTAIWDNCNGAIPQNGDDVTIGSGHTVTVNTDTATLNSLTVNGTLRFDNSGTGKTMIVAGNITINSGGIIHVATGGSETTHFLTIGGDLYNAGTFDGLPAAGRILKVTFNRNGNQTISGTGTTKFNTLTLNMGSSFNNILDVQAVISLAASSNPLIIQNGTFKLSSASTITPFTTGPDIPVTGGFWLNGGTVTTGHLSWDIRGLLRMSTGTLTIGINPGNSVNYYTGSVITIEGGTLNIAGRLGRGSSGSRVNYTQSGGTVTVVRVGSTSSFYAGFDIGATGSSFTMSGGTIVIQQSTSGPADYLNVASTYNVTGGTLQIGNAGTPSANTMRINSTVPVGNLVVDGSTGEAIKPTAQLLNNPLTVVGNVNVQTETTLNGNNLNLTVGGNWTNNGAFTAGNGTITLNGSNVQTIGGTAVTTFNNLAINNTGGVNLGNEVTVNGILTLTNGLFVLGDYDLTLGTEASIGGSPSASNMVIANGNGALSKRFSGTGSFTFPVGDNTDTANYSPATLNFTSGSFSDAYATVRVTDAKHPANTATHHLSRYWTVSSNGITNFSCDATFDYVGGSEDVVGSESTLKALKYDSGRDWTIGDPVDTGNHRLSMTVSSFSDFTGGDNPTAVTLAAFTATPQADGILLTWETAAELDNAGFNLYRSKTTDGPYILLNDTLIPPQFPGEVIGGVYTWPDTDVQPGVTYFYKLEDVDVKGVSTFHGPVTVTAPSTLNRRDFTVFLPLVIRQE